MILSNSSACATVLGNPSKMNPFSQSASCNLASTNPFTISSETNWPWSINFLASNPSGVLFAIAPLKMSPVEIWGISYFLINSFAWVPFPAPGAPNNIIFIIFHSMFGWKHTLLSLISIFNNFTIFFSKFELHFSWYLDY